jgi:hypothetical protein
MEEPEPATAYERLRRRSVTIAQLWALSECCRIVFAAATFLVPPVVVIFIVFEEKGIYGLGDWRLFAGLLLTTTTTFLLWWLADRSSERLLQMADDTPRATAENE